MNWLPWSVLTWTSPQPPQRDSIIIISSRVLACTSVTTGTFQRARINVALRRARNSPGGRQLPVPHFDHDHFERMMIGTRVTVGKAALDGRG